MKPVKLTMTAFGPYKDTEIIDFAELNGHRLFVVSGNTGAGKTSIFDAICFALYGEASGEDRSDSRMLRSHFADDNVYTSVEFEFELKGRMYRVLRQLSHVKAGNKSATGERYELYEITNGREVPLTDRFIVSQVDQKLQEILGLTKDQFSQIVMLPQGEFRKLLTSETENKEEILRRIFKTGLYKIVADRLNENRKTMQRICEELAGIREFHINNVKAALSGRDGSELSNVFGQQHYNTYQVLEALEQELDYYAGQINEHKQQLQSETAKHQESTAVYHQAQNMNEQFALLDQKVTTKQHLDNQEQAYKAKMQQLTRAEHAVHLQVYEQHDLEMAEECSRKSKLLEEALTEAAQVEASLQSAKALYEQEEGKGQLREQTMLELDRLKGFLPTVQEMNRKQQAVATLEAESTALAKQLQALESELGTMQTERAAAAAQVKELEGKASYLTERMEKLNLLREQAKIVQDYLGLVHKAEREQQEVMQQAHLFEQAEQSYTVLEARWVEGQAGILASHLHDGEPCPVCGGVDHPKKADLTGDIPTKDELDQRRSERADYEKKYLAAKATHDATTAQIQEKQRQVVEHGFHLETIQTEYDALVEAGKASVEEVKRLKADSEQLMQLKQSLETLESKLDAVRANKETLTSRYNDRKTAHSTEKALYEQSLAAVPEDVRNLAKLEQRIRETEESKSRLEADWRRAQQQYTEANERHVKAVAGRDHATSQKRDAQAAKEKARQSFIDALKQAGFAAEEDYNTAKMTEPARTALKQDIEAYNEALIAIRQQIGELSQALAGKERQDLETMKHQLEQQSQHIETIRSLCIQAQNVFDKGVESKANILEAEDNWAEAERQHQLVKDLYDVVRGENRAKVSFERYLQIEFLEKIIHIANQRLQRMSNGQYVLVRSGRLEKRGKQSGLGLDVYDNYTGQLRDVKTLSGGEKFNASLCLALGMADVIQSYEGGISLETMFIDEGFGSLDEESLNKAIDTLIDLQQSGRMIGVISHVQELKQAIPAILEVKKTKEGYSYTQFQVS